MNQQKSLQRISEILALFVTQIEIYNAMGLFDINRIAEDILIPIFSEVYDLKSLVNLNTLSENFEGLDLGDEKARIAFQITSKVNNQKIKETLQSIVNKEYYEIYKTFVIYDITSKQAFYSGAGWSEIIGDRFIFSKNNILDCKDLSEKIRHLNFEKIKKIEEILEKQIVSFIPSAKIPLLSNTPKTQGFVGRENYLNDLRMWYANDTTRIFVLHGLGGVGKSAIALKFAEEIKNNFRAHIFVDMRGLDINSLSESEVMFEIIKHFHPDVQVNLSLDNLKSRYISLMNEIPTLIVLDNVLDRNAVGELTKGNACLLITTRDSFILSGGKSKRIEPMSLNDARNLLFSIANEVQFEGQAEQLAHLAGYLPMALLPLAALMAENPMETGPDLVEKYQNRKERLRLADPNRKDLTVFASFDLSYESLTNKIQQCWCQLSVFQADFDELGAAAIWGKPGEKELATETLKKLVKNNLIEFDKKVWRFRLHDLARDFLIEKIAEDELALVQHRHAKHYSWLLAFAEIEQQKQGFAYSARLIDADWYNIKKGQEWASLHFLKDEEARQICIDYSVHSNVSFFRLHPREYIQWQKTSLEAAIMLNDVISEIRCLEHIAYAFEMLGEYQKVLDFSLQGLIKSRSISDRNGEARCLSTLGLSFSRIGKYLEAIPYFEEGIRITQKLDDPQGESALWGNLGIAYRGAGMYDKAVECAQKGLKLSRELKDEQGEGTFLSNLGNSYFSLGNYTEAIESHQQSLQIARSIKDRRGESARLGALGAIHNKIGDFRNALIYSEQAVQIAQELNDRHGEATYLSNLGNSYIAIGDTNKGYELLKEALKTLEEIQSPNATVVKSWLSVFCDFHLSTPTIID